MSKNCPIMQRMKDNYESRSKNFLTRRIPVIMRIDGKTFSSYTKGLETPFDNGLIEDLNHTAIHLCENIQGAKCAYIQSDEISILITDYSTLKTDAWFNYNVQKMTSISASMASSKFNILRARRYILDNYQTTPHFPNRVMSCEGFTYSELDKLTLANFDSRVANYPNSEVNNYFVARQRDAVKNSIASTAQSLYSPSELHGKNKSEQQEMIFQKGINWNDLPVGQKRGRFIIKVEIINDIELDDITYTIKYHADLQEYVLYNLVSNTFEHIEKKRSKWTTIECPEFSKNLSINSLI